MEVKFLVSVNHTDNVHCKSETRLLDKMTMKLENLNSEVSETNLPMAPLNSNSWKMVIT